MGIGGEHAREVPVFVWVKTSEYSKATMAHQVLDECCLVLNRTPLFMFVKPLVVLLSNILVCFSVFWCCRSLRWNLGKKSEKGQKKRSMLLAIVLERKRSDRAQCARAQCPQSSTGLVSPRIKRLPLPALWFHRFQLGTVEFLRQLRAIDRTICNRSHTWLRSSALPAIERSPLTWQHLCFV